MATLNVHAAAAMSVSGLAATSLLVGGLATAEQVVLYFILGTTGGLLPDLDSDHSRSLKAGFFLASVLTAFFAVFRLAPYFSVAELAILWLAVFAGVRYGAFWIFTRLTRHRGLFHSVPAAVLCGLTTAAISHHTFQLAPFPAWLAGLFVTLGYLVHLVLDEIYSIDLGGVRMRRSFGTALKFFSWNSWRTSVLLYAATGLAFYLAPDLHDLSQPVVEEQAYRQVLNRLLPSGNWFAYRETLAKAFQD